MVKINMNMPKACVECRFCTKTYQVYSSSEYLVCLFCHALNEFVKYCANDNYIEKYKSIQCPLEECEEE